MHTPHTAAATTTTLSVCTPLNPLPPPPPHSHAPSQRCHHHHHQTQHMHPSHTTATTTATLSTCIRLTPPPLHSAHALPHHVTFSTCASSEHTWEGHRPGPLPNLQSHCDLFKLHPCWHNTDLLAVCHLSLGVGTTLDTCGVCGWVSHSSMSVL